MHTQRLAKAAPIAVEGNREAFVELRESRDAIAANLDALASGDALKGLAPSSSDLQPPLAKLIERWNGSQSAASVIVANEKALLAFGDVIKKINDASPRLQQLTEEITALKLQSGAPAREIATAAHRVGRNAGFALAICAGSLAVGILGYHFLIGLSWIDALLNPSMILGGMGPLAPIKTDAGKVFASFYALYSGLIVLAVAGLIFAPVFHRFLHFFHASLDEGDDEGRASQ